MKEKRVAVESVKKFMKSSFVAVGVPETDADIIVDILIRSDLRGIRSHGIGRLKLYIDRIRDGILQPQTHIETIKEYPATALLDGNNGMGHVISYRAMEIAIQKAQNTGIAAVSVRNSSHFGIAGYYADMAIQKDMAGMAVTNARPSIAPTFGKNPMMGTNPIAFGCPTDEECPFLLDMATSIAQRGKIEVLERQHQNIPPGWAIDGKGDVVSDPSDLLKMLKQKAASFLPLGGEGEKLGGYKGYGMAMMVEILSSLFSSGPFGWGLSGFDENQQKIPHRLGHFFIAVNISAFIDIKDFKKLAGDLVRSMRQSETLPGHERIYTAGEKEFDYEQSVPRNGIPLNARLQENLRAIAADLDITADFL